jgi:hypothetical protein
MFKIFSLFYDLNYYIYLRYIRYRIYCIENVNDVINIMKNICLFTQATTSDQITTVITDCLNIYPLYEIELQKFSILQQNHNLELGIENYASFILWISSIYSIIERKELLLK